jgi:hypothetical protein
MAVLLEDGACKIPPAHNQNLLVVLLQLLDKGNEIAVTADDHERVDVIPRESHLERVQSQVDVRSIFVAARRQIPLHHLDGVLRHAAAVFARAFPVAVGNFCDDFSTFLDGLQNCADIEMAIKSTFDPDLDVIEVDEYSYL